MFSFPTALAISVMRVTTSLMRPFGTVSIERIRSAAACMSAADTCCASIGAFGGVEEEEEEELEDIVGEWK